MKRVLLGLACFAIASSLYCASICLANTYVDCNPAGPPSCTNCDTTYFSGGVCSAGPNTALDLFFV